MLLDLADDVNVGSGNGSMPLGIKRYLNQCWQDLYCDMVSLVIVS